MQSRVLVIYGSFGVAGLNRLVTDWSKVLVLEVDARLPEKFRRKGAEVIPGSLLAEPAASESTMLRAQELLDAFLEDKAPVLGLNTTREFRSACLSLVGMRLVVPYVRTLLEAAEIMKLGPWERIVISPGAGVCTRAWEQVGRHFEVPVTLLAMDRQLPPALWMLRRRFSRWRLKRRTGQGSGPVPFQLPAASPGDALLCVDSRLMPILGEAGAKAGWRAAPSLSAACLETLEPMRRRYQAWWQGWWAAWAAEHAEAGLSDHEALRSVGDWMSDDVYAKHAAALDLTRAHLAELRPRRILLGSVLGMVELMWVLAARELGIQVVAYTLDDPIQPKLCFAPDLLLVDDLKHEWLARERGLADRTVRVRTHRHMPKSVPRNSAERAGARPQILLTASFYLGHTPAVPSETILWASELVVEVARRMPEADFAIKFHPLRERPDPKFSLDGFHHLHLWQAEVHFHSLQPPANVRLIMPEMRLSELLPTTSIMLHLNSYASLEACSAEVPVISLSPSEPTSMILKTMRHHGALCLAGSAAELRSQIQLLIQDASALNAQLMAQKLYLDHYYPMSAPSLLDGVSAFPLS